MPSSVSSIPRGSSRWRPRSTFARPLLGSYGPVTAEAIKNGKGRYVAGDYAGLSGLQGQYDAVLGGTPGVKVTASDKPEAPLFEKACHRWCSDDPDAGSQDPGGG